MNFQLTRLIENSQILSTKEKKPTLDHVFPLMTSYGYKNLVSLTSSQTNPGTHHLKAAMFFVCQNLIDPIIKGGWVVAREPALKKEVVALLI